jgi:hypothetical protein
MMRGTRGGGTRVVPATSLLILSLIVTGCTGDGESRAFQREFADDPVVESMELTSHDNQPSTGGVSGDVVARETASDEEIAALAARIGDYTRDNADRMRGKVSLAVGGIEMVVTGDAAIDDERARLLLALRADPSVTSAAIEETTVSVTGGSAEEAILWARDLPPLLEDIAPSRPWRMSIRSADDCVALTGEAALMADAARLWDAVVARVPVSGIRARDDDERFIVALRHEADLAGARAASADLSLGGGMSTAFESDLIRLGDSDGEDARLLFSRLDEPTRARISYVWISDTRIQVAVRTDDDLASLADVVDAALPPRISEAWLVSENDADTRLAVRPSGDAA